MTDFIRELYYDNIKPQSEFLLSDRLTELCNHMDTTESVLSSMLNDEQRELFLDYVDTCSEATALSDEERFIAGFRLGARFAADVFNNGSDESFLRDVEIATDL